VSLRRTEEKQVKRHAHLLVAMAFLPGKTASEEVNHIDFDKLNNAVTNLEWCSHAENMAHARDNGRFQWPRKNGS
jgi:HNH endonuclease